LLQGAVSFGNDRELVRKQEQVMGENAWSVTLVDGTNLVGKWKLQQKQNKEYELTDIELTIEKPDVNIQGLLWLSTGKPRSQDALPDFSNWVSGLRSIPLRTLQLERETFPPLIELLIKTLSFTPRNSSEEKNNQLIPVASLGQWQFRYQLRQEIFKQMTNKGILSTNTFSQFLPMIWRRHPHLPMIQALPMTQNQSPPNYPAASRQLVPYELPVNSEGSPNVWDFGITEEKGALNWAKYLKPEMLKPAQEWVQQLDLSLVSLSLPGLVLSPHNQFPHVKLELKTQLYLQYRFDLPYTDEINALAQLPKVLPKPDEISPLPNSLQPQPAKALTRETFKDYWQQLAERASLASGDAIFGLAKREDKTLLENLIEPLVWEVNATFNLDTYPGRLELSNADNQAKLLSLEGNKALEGISGKFIELNGNIKLNGGSNNSYNITAGSMAARLENDQIRDQRGLSRGVSKVDVDEKKSGKLLITTVLFQSQIQGQIQSQFYNLTTTLEALPLQIDEKETWRLWFRDVPFQDTVFDRLTTLSPQAEDINDPEAQSLDFNYRSGYEWRLNGSTTSRLPLKLFGLDFYPLRLAKMTIIDQQIDTIEIIGRLQLPLQGIGEIETLSNAVNLKLKWKQELKKYVPNSLSLASFPSPVSLVDSLGEWILNADKNSNTNLRLEWKSIKLNGDKTAIELSQLTLQFYLFNTNWIVPLSGKSLSFPNTTVVEHIIPETDDFSLTGIVVDFSQLSSPNVSLDFSVKFGDRFGEIPPQNRRITNGLQVLYTFTEGTGDTVLDRTQTPNPLNLKIKNTDSGTIDWLSGGGLRIKKSNIIKSITKATKLITACKKTNEISIEVWIKPQQEIQKAGRIVTLSEDRNNRNFTLAQGIFEFQSKEYNVRLRHTEAGVPNDGLPALQTRNDGLPALQTRSDAIITDQPSHLIYTRKKDEVKIYLNGQELSPQKSIASKGDFSNWDESYFFALGNEMTEDRAWLGEYYLIAVYNRALTLEEVQQNFSVGHLFPEILDNSEKAIAFQGIFQYNLIKQSITSFNGRLLDDLNIVISQEDNLNNILVNQSLQIHWQKCTAEKIPYLLPGILLDPSQISGYAALTFTIESKNNAMPLLKINSATVEALMVTHWGEFLQEQKPASNQAIFGSSAGDLAIGYLGELTTPEKFDDLEKTWQESLLFNGVVELKNLISWPQEITINNTGITLPSASVNPTINLLSHYRHSLKILFNQHQILPEQLTVGPGQNLLFTLSKDKSWQFLAVVEHQLIIVNPNEDLTQIRSTDEHRWTAVQNISITTPEQFGTFLKNLDQVSIENPALATTTSPFQINFGYLRSDLRTSLVKEFNKLSSHILLVEATTPFWLRKTPLKDLPQPISLQILPNGTQQAILSRPQDYYPTAPTDPQWLLLIMPFLGRLQPSSEDQLESQSMTKTHLDTLNALQVDPILLLHYWRKLSPSQAIPALKLALALSHWTDLGELQINLSGFDLMLNRLWSRLDPLALEESWFRLQNPPPEAKPTFLQSILSAFPDTSARLSRDTALKRLFSFVRTFYPPQVSSNLSLDDMALIQQSEEAFLLLLQGVIDKPQANSIPYGWLLSGILLVQAFKGGAASSLNRHPVATLLSTRFKGGNNQANPFPQSLTVSPYLGLQLQSWAETPVTELRLVVAELLCLNPSSQVLRPVASYTWESQKFSTNLDFQDILNNPAANLLKLREKFRRNNIILSEKDVNIQVSGLANGEWEIVDQETQFTCRVRVREQDKQLIFYQDRLTIGELAKSWALQTQERLYPESPFAILRFREIDQVISEKPTTIIPLVVRYAFELVEIEPSPLVVQRTFRLRSPLRQLRFREAQFNPGLIPNLETIKPFEVAPPQTAGVQPIYLLPPESNSQVDWGLSALRVSIHYSEGQQAIADSLLNGSEHQHTLWWQGCQHTVQFRSAKTAGNTNAVAGLPPLFRAPAIKGFLPAVSDLPLPDIKLNHQEKLQSILPGSLSYLLLGNRPGVMFALRHQLLRQPLGQSSEVLVSGSIPVQHRMPRPVPLPDNQGQEVAGTEARTKERALQTWASYFEPQKRLIAETSPIDEAFYAQCGDHPARRLQVKLISPKYGAILADWDGLLAFEFKMNPNEAGLSNWQIKKVNLIDGLQSIEYQIPEVLTSVLSCNFIPNDKNKSILKRILSEKLGYSVTVRVSIEPNPEDKHFQQILSFPLILAGQFARPLALEPYFIHFEDPEYNRRLASASAHSSRTIKLKKASEMNVQLITLTLSADRREYNTDSLLSFRFDWNLTQEELVVLKETEETLQKKTTATLKFTRISNDQEIEFEYAQESGQVLNRAGHLQSFFLNQFIEKNNANRVGLQAGDKLKISVTKIEITEYNVQEDLDKNPIVLIVNIVATPVNPVPQAAYALLRTYKFASNTPLTEVECVRFAWSPEPERIELVCAEDLRQEVVRRRAVFHWQDSTRISEVKPIYEIQKITETGSTHFPGFE
jgi:hypothetical protein